MTAGPPSILAGVDAFVDRCLDVLDVGRAAPHYRNRQAYARVAKTVAVNGEALVSGMYDRIEANWPGTPCRSRQNWRWVPKPHLSDRNESLEKQFEKTLVQDDSDWVNMIPVASGLLPDVDEGGRRIDLAREIEPGCFEFVELKSGSDCDTPLHAAIEILGYGMLYLFSRVHLEELGYDPTNPRLSASHISLKVLAPWESYDRGSLRGFEVAVNRGLRHLVGRLSPNGFEMDFAFERFAMGAAWPPKEAMAKRRRVY